MTTPRKDDKSSDKGVLPVPEPTPQAVPVEVPTDPQVTPVPSALLLLSDRVATIEEAIAGLLHTHTDQQGSLAQLRQHLEARLGTLEALLLSGEKIGLVPVMVTPQVAAALTDLMAFMRTDPKFAYDVSLSFRRQEKVRNGPLTKLHTAIVGTAVEDGT